MHKKRSLVLLFLPFLLIACAHKINLSPPLNTLDINEISAIGKNVGYYISAEDKAKEVVTPGGGGDKVKYTPYGDLEPALKQALDNIFADVYAVHSMDDQDYLTSNDISYVFIPVIETDSSSSSVFTWPPTDFTISLTCRANDPSGKTVWNSTVEGKGKAEFSEFKHDLSLSARRAAKDAFVKFEKEINQSDAFK